MTLVGTFPSRDMATRPARNWAADIAVFVGAAVLLWLVVRVGRGTAVPWTVPTAPSTVSTDPSHLPYYAARSLLRMFAALGLSLIFTFFYATAAARSRRAEKVLIPLLDFLQSVPVLGFPRGHHYRVHRFVSRLAAGFGMRVDLRDLHLAGVEHDVQLLPLADRPCRHDAR